MRKLKIKIVFISFFASISLFSQETNEISNEIPILSPQTPTTADLGKFGEVQVNESTGIISPSIPVFEYDAGKMSIPLSLTYTGNGVRVNQEPTWLGINWNLNPGGVITRIVKDRPDELTPYNQRQYHNSTYLNSLPGIWIYDITSQWYNTVHTMGFMNVDSEVDIFNYNFLGYSGSFYLDKENKVHLIKYDKEITIIFTLYPDNKSVFTVKTPQGDTYYFGGPTASESSKTCVESGAGACSDALALPMSQNAFYLYEISFLNGGNVTFEYTQNGSNICNYKIGLQESIKMNSASNSPCLQATPRNIISQVESSITLKKIKNSFNNQFVEFETSQINKCANIYKLNNVNLKSITNSNTEVLLKSIKMNYLVLNKESDPTLNKFFLSKVEFYNKKNTFEFDYELTYITPENLPKKNSFAQDELGYYNGKLGNTTLLPLTNYTNLNNTCSSLADREANLQYSQCGALQQIKYPTGGYSNFEYELPYKGKIQLYQNHIIKTTYRDPNSNYTSSSSFPPSGNYTEYYKNYFIDGIDQELILNSTTNITARLNATVLNQITNHSKVSFYAIKRNATSSQTILIGEYNFNSNQLTYSNSYNVSLAPGTYYFKLSIHRHSDAVANSIIATAELSLPSSERVSYNPGLRIKRIITNDNKSNNVTRYYYNDLNNLNKESYSFNPSFVYQTLEGSNVVYNLTANNVKANFNNDIGKYAYTNVTISYGGDNFENGGKQLEFHNDGNQLPVTYAVFAPLGTDTGGIQYQDFVDAGTNQAYLNSIVSSEKIVDKNLNVLKSIKYNYRKTEDNIVGNMKMYSFSSNGRVFLYYDTKSFKHRLISTVTNEYPSGVANPLITSVVRSFTDDKVSLPSSIETTNSENVTQKIKNYYPNDVNLMTDLSSQDKINIQGLINKHNIAQVIKTERFVDNELIETKQILFKNFNGLILPNIIKTKKGNTASLLLEDRIIFHDYNYYGNPLLFSMKDGRAVKYVYNNKQQVILKLENFNGQSIIDDSQAANQPCYYQLQYPELMVTEYTYDPLTNNLVSVLDPKCNKMQYTYDDFNRLLQIKDNAGNVISENKYNYKQ